MSRHRFLIGDYWRSRKGDRWQILDNEIPGPYASILARQDGGITAMFSNSGEFCYMSGTESKHDLVAPWVHGVDDKKEFS